MNDIESSNENILLILIPLLYCAELINYRDFIRITTPLTQHDPRLISPRRREPDNYVDFCASPPG